MIRHMTTVAAMVLALATQAGAATFNWTATLDQAQEVPVPKPVPGAGGSAMGTIDTVTGLLKWNIQYFGLSGAPRGLHFHAAAGPGETAPIVVRVDDISGLDSPSIGEANLPQTGVEDFLKGDYYINVHTELNRSGEIRGQVVVSPVPVPAAAPLLLSGLAAIGAAGLARKRRARAA